MKIYIASPFFNKKELENVKKAEEILLSRGFDVFSPRLHEVRGVTAGTAPWSKQTFENDRANIDSSRAVVMLYYGNYSDSGTAWECGYAFALGKPVVTVHLGDSSNLMIHESSGRNITFEELKTYDFTSLPQKSYSGKMF